MLCTTPGTSPHPDGVPVRSPRPLGLLAGLLTLMLLALGLTVPSASAADYPLPTRGTGMVSPTNVQAGQCVTFSGGGFAPLTPITIQDDGVVVGHTTSDAQGNFSTRVCFSTQAKHGRHTLTATGLGANGAERTVTAYVRVVGGARVSGQAESAASTNGVYGGGNVSGAGGGNVGGLPFTGSDIREMVLFGLVLLSFGAVLTRRGHAARSRRRAARAAA